MSEENKRKETEAAVDKALYELSKLRGSIKAFMLIAIKELILIIRMGGFTTITIRLCTAFLLKLFRMTVGSFTKSPNRTGTILSRTNASAGFGDRMLILI